MADPPNRPAPRLRRSAMAAAGGLLLAAVVAGAFVLTSAPPTAERGATQRYDVLIDKLEVGTIAGADVVALGKQLEEAVFAAAPARDSAALESARSVFSEAVAQLAQDPDPLVRDSVRRIANSTSRAKALADMRQMAAQGAPAAGALDRVCAAILAAYGDDAALGALERARARNPEDLRLWRLTTFELAKRSKVEEANAAGFVAQALASAGEGRGAEAEEAFAQAEAVIRGPAARSFVLGRLGDYAAAREDFRAAAQRYREAISLHRQTGAGGLLAIDVQKLARALTALGQRREACDALRAAGEQVDPTCPPPPPLPKRGAKRRSR